MDEKQIQALEKLLDQSVMGFHHLFDKTRIASILKTPTEELDFFTSENVANIQKLFSQLIQKGSMEEKRAYLERLNPHDFEVLLRSYFHIVDSTIMKQEPQKH